MPIAVKDTLNLESLSSPPLPPFGSLAFFQSGGEPRLVDSSGEEIIFNGAPMVEGPDGTSYNRRSNLRFTGDGVVSIGDDGTRIAVEISGGLGPLSSHCVSAIRGSGIGLAGSILTISAPFTLAFAHGRDAETGALVSKSISLMQGSRELDLGPYAGENRILFLGLLADDVLGEAFVIGAEEYIISNGTPTLPYGVWYDPGTNLVTVSDGSYVNAVPVLHFNSIGSDDTVWSILYPPRLGNGICLKYHF
jgi:hypothetical protein